MRKFLIVICSTFLFLLVACGGNEAEESSKPAEETDKETEAESSVDVNKGILNVEVTLPSMFFEGEEIEDVIAKAKEEGVKEIVENDDGSLTYKMSKKEHKEIVNEMSKEIKESVSEIIDEDEFPSIKEIDHEKDFSAFTVVVDKEAYENSLDGFAIVGLAMSGMYYQVFDGVDAEDSKVVVNLEDEATGEHYSEVVYPDAFDDIEDE